MSVQTFDIIDSCGAHRQANTKVRLGQMLKNVPGTVYEWLERHRSRRALSKLNDRMLADIGLTRADVEAETIKPFWVR